MECKARRERWGVAASLVFVLALFWWVVSEGKICRDDEKAKKENCAVYSFAPFLALKVAKPLNDYSGAIQALSAVFVGFFTFGLLRTSETQARIADRQMDLSERQFVATHRPKLIVRKVIMRQDSGYLAGSRRRPVLLEFDVVNVGTTTANLIAAVVHLEHNFLADRTLLAYSLLVISWDDRPDSIKGGEACSFRSFCTIDDQLESGVDRILHGSGFGNPDVLNFCGELTYEDDIGTRRTTGIYRGFRQKDRTFQKIDNDDREYAD